MPRKLHTAADVWKHIDVRTPDECWLWIRSVSSGGYGQFYFDGRLHTAHRVTYELVKGPVPADLQLDHLCRNRRCCNPAHLEAVTGLENVKRAPNWTGNRTHCPRGHAYAGRNLVINSVSGARMCRTCQNADSRDRKRRKRAVDPTYASGRRRPQAAKDSGPGCPGTAAPRTTTV